MSPEQVDVLIVGSGPVGSTFARLLTERLPHARILMVDGGRQLTAHAGANVRNIEDGEGRAEAQRRSQGPCQHDYEVPSVAQRAAAWKDPALRSIAALARPGTHLVELDVHSGSGMPAAALSTNIGGMGAHWTCAAPRPGGSERIAFIEPGRMDRLLDEAQDLLSVTSHAFAPSAAALAIEQAIAGVVDAGRPPARRTQPMPLACRVEAGKRYWAGADVVLGAFASAQARPDRLQLRGGTWCQRLICEGPRVVGAWLRDADSGREYPVHARTVVVAADALRTPQLLWASGIRPRALGHYLNDQPQTIHAVRLRAQLIERHAHAGAGESNQGEATIGVFWVPFHEPDHPFHGQVMHMDTSPISLQASTGQQPVEHVVALGWFCAKQIRFEDCIEFCDTEEDFAGLPKMTLRYELTPTDLANIDRAIQAQMQIAQALGEPIGGQAPCLLPAGSSLHYQGTTRMGPVDDGSSVCDANSRVWGFDNLYVGGNGVIPTATACNPTLTSVALAVAACESIVADLSC